MKVEELRIGNYVKSKRHDLDVVTQVGKSNVWGKFNEDILPMPIPITEDWLIKFGFESDGIEWWDGIICLGIFKDGIYYLPTESLDYRVGQEIKYVHQLQNLYFALTGSDYPNVV